MTYEMGFDEGINVAKKLLEQLEKNKNIKPNDKIEYAILHDALVIFIDDLENELHRQQLINEFQKR